MKKRICVFLFDGFSDWEIAYVTPELNKSERFDLIYVSEKGNSITSMGGLHVKPTCSLTDLNPETIDMLILPGGTAWEEGKITAIEDLTKRIAENEKPIAAICAATTYLGQLGLLNKRKHTSNGLNYLKEVAPDYRGDEHYVSAWAVADKNIITATGVAPIEFAREIFRAIELYDEENLEKWFQVFKNGVLD
jgi:putative intracellular protease/amidase